MNKLAKKIKKEIQAKEEFFGNLLKHYDTEWVSSEISELMEVTYLIFIKIKNARFTK